MVISASQKLLRLWSWVAKRRRPKRWESELMVHVPWNRTMVEMEKPQTSICQPLVPDAGKWLPQYSPKAYIAAASKAGTMMSKRSRKRNSGKRAKSRTLYRRVGKFDREVIHRTWLHQKPCSLGECTSLATSEWRWWWRWCPAHHNGPRCTAVLPNTAKRNCTGREVLNVRCEK